MPPLSVDDLLTTTRSVRQRLDLDRPVERHAVEECLRIAFQAPTGSNQQDWGWVLVDDRPRALRWPTSIVRVWPTTNDVTGRARSNRIEPRRPRSA